MILRLKRTPGIYLVGFMACGKSTVGRLLADELGWHFVDIDSDIENTVKMPISAIFDQQGEDEFRRIERDVINMWVRKIESGSPTVVALGGGAFTYEENYELVSVNGVSIWLDCPLELIEKRVAPATNRPLARDPKKLADLYESRRGAYERADFRVTVESDDPKPVLGKILNLSIF